MQDFLDFFPMIYDVAVGDVIRSHAVKGGGELVVDAVIDAETITVHRTDGSEGGASFSVSRWLTYRRRTAGFIPPACVAILSHGHAISYGGRRQEQATPHISNATPAASQATMKPIGMTAPVATTSPVKPAPPVQKPKAQPSALFAIMSQDLPTIQPSPSTGQG